MLLCDIYETGEEIFILMKCYQKILRSELDTGLLKKIMEVLAAVHTAKIPDFLVREEGWQNKEKQEERQEEKANLLLVKADCLPYICIQTIRTKPAEKET